MYLCGRRSRSVRLHVGLYLAGLAFIGLAQPLIAQVSSVTQTAPAWLDAPIILTLKETGMAEALAAVAKHGSCNIAADGVPLKVHADFAFRGTVRQALDLIADTFDCAWTLSKQGAVLFRKRFRDRADRPQLHPAEWRRTARDVLTALCGIDFDMTDNASDYLKPVARALTPEQIRALRAGERIPASTLPDRIHPTVARAILTSTFSRTAGGWRRLKDQLDGLAHARLQFEKSGTNPEAYRPGDSPKVPDVPSFITITGPKEPSPYMLTTLTPRINGRLLKTFIYPPLATFFTYNGDDE